MTSNDVLIVGLLIWFGALAMFLHTITDAVKQYTLKNLLLVVSIMCWVSIVFYIAWIFLIR